jgi:iron(III) transport system ATP-binding protein
VALARALAREPALVLLDEPFSNLDPDLRREVREETVALLHATGSSAIFVTHDVEEAFSIADTLSILFEGRVEQSGTPRELYDAPASRYVARLCGPASFLPIEKVTDGAIDCALGSLDTRGAAEVGDFVVLRPEHLAVTAGGDLELVRRRFLGPWEELDVRIESHTLTCRIPPGQLAPGAARVSVTYDGVAAVVGPQ